MTRSHSSSIIFSPSLVPHLRLLVACTTPACGSRLEKPCKKGSPKVCAPFLPQKIIAYLILVESRDRFATAVYNLINAVRDSQSKWVIGVTSFGDYAKRRRAGVGIDIIVTAMQWLYDLTLPPRIWDHGAMKVLMDETAIGVFLFNDIVSLKKEIVEGYFDSTVPLLVENEDISAQEATDKAVKMMEKSWKKLLAAGEQLVRVAETDKERMDVQTLVNGCKDITVGHVNYCLRSARYMSDAKLDGQGQSFKIVL